MLNRDMKLLSFKQFISEARSHSASNPKISAYDALEGYKDDPDIYISFTDVDKIGINPNSTYNTPIGIYTYPLKEIWKGFNHKSRRVDVPFAQYSEHIWIIKPRGGKFVKDLYKDYNSKSYDTDMDKIRKIYSSVKNIEAIIDEGTKTAKVRNPVSSFWNVTKMLGSEINSSKPYVGWNTVMRKLGYSGFADKSGKSIIHESEPIQAVFLSVKSFTVVKEILNKWYPSSDKAMLMNGILSDDKNERQDAAKNPNATEEILKIAAKDKEFLVRLEVSKNPTTPESVLSVLIDDARPSVAIKAIDHHHMTLKLLKRAMKKEESGIRYEVMINDKIDANIVKMGMTDDDRDVRSIAFDHKLMTTAMLKKIITGKYSIKVMKSATLSDKITQALLALLLKSSDVYNRKLAADSYMVTKETLAIALNDKDIEVQLSAIGNDNITKELVQPMLNSPSARVRLAASNTIKHLR
ncbi:MAG: hypothetical protein R8M45_04470 [Ghiorsea sp.]